MFFVNAVYRRFFIIDFFYFRVAPTLYLDDQHSDCGEDNDEIGITVGYDRFIIDNTRIGEILK